MSLDRAGAEPGLVVLVGLMASGKSAVGTVVAERTGRSLVDVDEVILAQTGLTTPQLWERAGEAGYRPLERDISVHALAEGRAGVLGLPAGAIEDELVRQALATADPLVVWLRGRPATLAARIGDGDHRPLVTDDPEALLRRQSERRAPPFEAVADVVVDIDDLDVAQVADRIVRALET